MAEDDTRRRPVTSEIASHERDTDFTAGWTTRLENPDELLRQEAKGTGVRLYEKLLRDPQVFSLWQQRTLALQACEWEVLPASDKRDDVRRAEFVKQVLSQTNFDRASRSLMQAVITGYKPVEIMWEVSEGDIWISQFRPRRPSRFLFDMENRPRMLTLRNTWDGEPVPERKFNIWSYGSTDFNPYGLGLGYQLFWYVWFKKHGIKFWAWFTETFAAGTPVGKYPQGAEDEDKKRLLKHVKDIRRKTGITIPNDFAIEILEAKRAGEKTYEGLCEYMDRAIAKVLVGQTLTSEEGRSGSRALGQVHGDVKREIVKADADDQCESLNEQMVKWLVDYNFPPSRARYPKVWRRTEPEVDLEALAGRDKILLVDMQFGDRVPESYISNTYNIPLAKEGERTLRPKKERPEKAAASSGDDFSEPAARPGQAMLEAMADQATDEAAKEMEALLRPVLDFIDGAGSLEEIGERLYSFYPRLDSHRFQMLLERALFASALTGYSASAREVKHD